MRDKSYYLYGFIKTPQNTLTLSSQGVEQSPIRLTSAHGYALAASELSGGELTHSSRNELLGHLATHQRVLEEMMYAGEVIPMKFGTVIKGDKCLDLLCTQSKRLVEESFEEVQGKTEFDLMVRFSDLKKTLIALSQKPEIQALQNPKISPSKKMQLAFGKKIDEALQKMKRACAKTIVERLSKTTLSILELETTQEEMVTSLACLIKKEGESTLESEIQALDIAYEDQLHFRLVGPMPCNSFHALEIAQIPVEALAWARASLNLSEAFTLSELKKAYKTASLRLHPDQKAAQKSEALSFETIHSSYRLLSDFFENQSTFQTEEGWFGVRPARGGP
ncbi:MAG: GvpL/GvpF family gas vesicle protein [Desulfobacterales bacterium]|nr:GvpL/GvpF family gas vesicle protein [Desulfobacterales bacterium]